MRAGDSAPSMPRTVGTLIGRAVLFVLLVVSARQAHAQTCSVSTSTRPSSVQCTVSVTMNTSDILKLTLTSTSAALGTPTETDFTNGFRDVTGAITSATVKANRAFRLQVVGNTANFTFTNSGGNSFANPNKPASDLIWATTQAGLTASTNNMGTAATLISQGGTPGVSQSIFFRTKWQFNRDVPGTYALVVNFTLSAP
jgi:hypothetical protein